MLILLNLFLYSEDEPIVVYMADRNRPRWFSYVVFPQPCLN